jgi:hypothetical protein
MNRAGGLPANPELRMEDEGRLAGGQDYRARTRLTTPSKGETHEIASAIENRQVDGRSRAACGRCVFIPESAGSPQAGEEVKASRPAM